MKALVFVAFITFVAAPFVSAQTPPQPQEDFPQPQPPEGKKTGKKAKPMVEPEHQGVKPPLPVTPPTPEPTHPEETTPPKGP